MMLCKWMLCTEGWGEWEMAGTFVADRFAATIMKEVML